MSTHEEPPPQMPLGLKIVLIGVLLVFAGLCVHWLGLLGNEGGKGGHNAPSPSPVLSAQPSPSGSPAVSPAAPTSSAKSTKK